MLKNTSKKMEKVKTPPATSVKFSEYIPTPFLKSSKAKETQELQDPKIKSEKTLSPPLEVSTNKHPQIESSTKIKEKHHKTQKNPRLDVLDKEIQSTSNNETKKNDKKSKFKEVNEKVMVVTGTSTIATKNPARACNFNLCLPIWHKFALSVPYYVQ